MSCSTILNVRRTGSIGAALLLAGNFASAILVLPVGAQTAAPAASTAPAANPAPAPTPYRTLANHIPNREAAYYEAVWGIGEPSVKAVESGVILRFSYRVLDAAKATPLMDKKVEPLLVSPEKGIKLVVPSMDKVGQLRQAPHEIEAGQSYWMAFSNSGRLLKSGDRVDIVIGNFIARGLLVE